MTTLAEHIIVVGAENRPPMLEKSIYDSWASRIRLFIKGKKHGRMMLDSIDNAQQLQDNCDVQATNIILHGLPPDMYALVNNQEVAKDIWDRGETLKFVTDVKLAKSLYTTNYDQLYAYLSQHERHANEVLKEHSQADFPQLDFGLAVPTFQQGQDPIECINKAMAFLSAVASRFPPSNNQLRTSSNPRNQATIQDGRVTVQQVQGRQSQSFVGTGNRGIATTSKGNYAAGQPRVVKCYNFQGEWHMERQSDPGISEAPVAHSDDVQEMQYSEQTHIDDFQDNKIHSDSNIIPYSQYLQESQDAVIQGTNSSTPNDLLVLSLVEQMTDHAAHLDKED
ncbi:hypothetical protein Tco_0693536 [Tanacetum coccineum]